MTLVRPQVVSRSSDLVRATACVAALTDAVEALKIVLPSTRGFVSFEYHNETLVIYEMVQGSSLHRTVFVKKINKIRFNV